MLGGGGGGGGKRQHDGFTIVHFAGPVTYTTSGECYAKLRKGSGQGHSHPRSHSRSHPHPHPHPPGWLSKNTDYLPDGAAAVIIESKSSLLQAVVSSGSQFSGAQSKSFLHKSTVAASFMKSMAGLTSTLRQTNCSFIRSILENIKT